MRISVLMHRLRLGDGSLARYRKDRAQALVDMDERPPPSAHGHPATATGPTDRPDRQFGIGFRQVIITELSKAPAQTNHQPSPRTALHEQ